MSRSSPTGFVFSIVLEVAAVVVIVSLLPRIDLRPPAIQASEANSAGATTNQATTVDPAISPVSWTTSKEFSTTPPARETSYYEHRPAAPPLIESDPARSQYVEQRLDRASQQLVNSVGSYVAQAAGGLTSYQPGGVSPSPRPSDSRTTAFAPATFSVPVQPPQQTSVPSPGELSRRQTTGSL